MAANELKIKNKELEELLNTETFNFPKYSIQILNLANQNAQGTRPKVVGQLSELIQEFQGRTIKEWERWYLDKHPEAIKNATSKIFEMIENFREVMNEIDRNLIKKWVQDLVIIKTFIGLKFQEAIFKKISQILNRNYRLANPDEESKGIDGFINNIPISIKPHTYKTKKALTEKLEARIIYYEKTKDGLNIYYDELLFKEEEFK